MPANTTTLGYALSSEEHAPDALVHHARLAEEHGFTFALISDHFHPWIGRQGQSPFVWSVLGAIAQATETIRLGTGVTCPTFRIHPAIIAQAAATTAALMPGRFFLGLGTGENLNEHILGQRWPEWEVRAEMLDEAIEIVRQLWTGEVISHHGRHYVVENARLYTLPEQVPDLYVAASGPRMAEIAGRVGDGLISTGPDAELVEGFNNAGGDGPRFGQVTVCWGATQKAARRVAHEWWPLVVVHGEASQELPSPVHFEQLVQDVTEDQVAEMIPCGPDPDPILEQIATYADAGFDHVYLHQVGPDQAGFIEFAARELAPNLQRTPQAASR